MKDTVRNSWLEIFSNIKEIKKLKPWDHLDNVTPAVLYHTKSRTTYARVLGNGGETFGIIFYPDLEEYLKSSCQYERYDDSPNAVMFNHSSVSVMFLDKEDMPPFGEDLLKELGLSFRGRNAWPAVERYGERLIPALPNTAQIKQLLKDTAAMLDVCRALKSSDPADLIFKNCVTWKNGRNGADISAGIMEFEDLMDLLDNDFEETEAVSSIKNMKKKRYKVEAGIYYPAVPFMSGYKFMPETLAVSDRKNGEEYVVNENDDNRDEIYFFLDGIEELCRTKGKPSEIFVHDKYLYRSVRKISEMMDIKLTLTEGPLEYAEAAAYEIDEAINGIMSMLTSGNLPFDPENMPSSPEEFLQMLMGGALTAEDNAPAITVSKGGKNQKSKVLTIDVRLEDAMRSIRISADASFGTLHEAILNAFDFDNDHMYEFFLDNRNRGRGKLTRDDPYECYEHILGDHISRKGRKFLFLYDFGDCWEFECRVSDIETGTCTAPEVVRSEGDAPLQYPPYEEDE